MQSKHVDAARPELGKELWNKNLNPEVSDALERFRSTYYCVGMGVRYADCRWNDSPVAYGCRRRGVDEHSAQQPAQYPIKVKAG